MRYRSLQFSSRLIGITLLVTLSGSPLKAQAGDPKPASSDIKAQADSAYVNKLLAEAKWRAALAEYDAQTLLSYTYSDASWETHAAELRVIAGHVNDLGNVVTQLNGVRDHASSWQRVAIDRINPLLNDMAKNLNVTIKQLHDHEDLVRSMEYRDYLRTNADLASLTATSINDFVQYGRTGQQTEALQRKLELPPK